jgi:uncharacterized protein YbaP (TraB family)
MFSRKVVSSLILGFGVASGWIAPQIEAASCVWKVSASNGASLYLAGSWHALRRADYPLPATYNRAFESCNRLVFEISPRDLDRSGNAIDRAGEYPKSDNLKNHVDPRTYDYLRRFFGILGVSEVTFSRYRPWYISMVLGSFSRSHGLSHELGVESFLEKKARAASKPIDGLESLREHVDVYSGLSDRGSEALLLITFIPADKGSPDFNRMMAAWRRGDADFLTNSVHEGFRDFPAMADRLLKARNRNWIPKLEGYLRSGKTYLAVFGAAHLGGSDGVVALLRARGYKLEQL